MLPQDKKRHPERRMGWQIALAIIIGKAGIYRYKKGGVGDGTRTHNARNHNPVLCH